jgi:long-chain fatty acid transport protein
VSLVDFRSTWTDPNNVFQPVTMTPKGAFPPAIYAAYGMKFSNGMKFGIGSGLTIPGGGYVFWPMDWPGRYEIFTVDRKIYGAYLTAGLQLIPQLRLGGGMVYYHTTEHLLQSVQFLDNASHQIELGTTGGALSYDVSAEVTPVPSFPFTVAVDYKHQGVQHLFGHAHATDVPVALQPRLQDQGVAHTLTYPNQLNVGAALRVIEPVLVTFDWTWERFHVYQQDLFVGDRGVVVIVPRNYKNGYTLRLGAEVSPIPRLKLRVGGLHDTSPSRPETLSPTLPDSNVWAISGGIGYELFTGFEINAGYFHAFYDTVSTPAVVPGVTPEYFPATYDTRANIYALSVVWKP